MKHGSLFNGIGGFQLAAAYMGWQNIFSCEIDDFCNRVTKYHYPNCKQYEDIKTTNFTMYRGEIDILTGGFPCQPFSVAGKRLGTADERSLWGEMLRVVQEILPRWVVAENVPGLVNWNGGLVFEQVCADLENEGYEVQSYLLSACGVNAPHKRERVWFVAYCPNTRAEKVQQRGENGICEFADATNTNNFRSLQRKQNKQAKFSDKNDSERRTNANSNTERRKIQDESKTKRAQSGNDLLRCKHSVQNWDNFPTQPPVCCGDDGLSTELDGITFPKWRRESIKAYGNAIVPQVALQIFKAIQEIEFSRKE